MPPPELPGFIVLADSVVSFEFVEVPLMVSTEAASAFIALEPVEGAGIIDER